MQKVTILGWNQADNIGDSAYKIAFPILFPNCKLTFTDYINEPGDAIILGGGDVLNTYFFKQLEKYPLIPQYAMSVDTKTTKDIPNIFKKVISRNVGVNYLPDFTFVLTPNKTNGNYLINQLFKNQKAEQYSKVVVVVLNNYLMPKDNGLARDQITFDKVCSDLAKIIDGTNASFLFLPFGNGFPNNDRITNSYLYARCKFWKKNVIVYENLSVQDTLNICSASDAVISSRLHSSIFSCIGGTPFINLCHHDKTRMFTNTINSDWSINYWHFEYQKTINLLNEFLNKDYRSNLLKIAAENKKILLEYPLQSIFEG